MQINKFWVSLCPQDFPLTLMCRRGTQTGGWGYACNRGRAQSNHFINHYSLEPKTWWLMEGVVKVVAREEITVGVWTMYKCWMSGLLNRREKIKVAFLGRKGNPLWYSKLSVCWCSLCAAVTGREGEGNRGWERCAWGLAPEETRVCRDTWNK